MPLSQASQCHVTPESYIPVRTRYRFGQDTISFSPVSVNLVVLGFGSMHQVKHCLWIPAHSLGSMPCRFERNRRALFRQHQNHTTQGKSSDEAEAIHTARTMMLAVAHGWIAPFSKKHYINEQWPQRYVDNLASAPCRSKS